MSDNLRPSSSLKQRTSSSRQPTPTDNTTTNENSNNTHEMSTDHEQPPQPEPDRERDEDQPLLGDPAPGGSGKAPDNPSALWRNLFTGTAGLVQAGIWILTAYVWACVLGTKVILFSAHPLLNTAGLLLLTQSILLLQPTTTTHPRSKSTATTLHATLNNIALTLLLAGLVLIEYNKFQSPTPHHFESPHAILGLVTYIILGVQGLVGATALWAPGAVYGGKARARGVYKWHRLSGYALVGLWVATVAAATGTGFNGVLGVRLWVVLVAGGAVVVGLGARVRVGKLGF